AWLQDFLLSPHRGTNRTPGAPERQSGPEGSEGWIRPATLGRNPEMCRGSGRSRGADTPTGPTASSSAGREWWNKRNKEAGMQSVDPDRWEGAETRLGRTVRATVAAAVATSSRPREHHRKTNWLRDVILGGQDGLVNILGIILGVIAGGGSNAILLAAGFAAAIT